MKKINFVTTFSKNGYDLYGKKWIKSFKEHFETNENVTATLYIDFDLTTEPNINVLDINEEIPEHSIWVKQFKQHSNHHPYNKTMGERFSFKSFVIMNALSRSDDFDYVVWLDGDCIFLDNDLSEFPQNLLLDNFLACQNEGAHVESGILIFNKKHKDIPTFLKSFKDNYKVENLKQMEQPFDGFILNKTLFQQNLKFTDLNENHGAGGIQSDPNLTFLHPYIKQRFRHNIGYMGKLEYDNFKIVAAKDKYLKFFANKGSVPKSTEQINDIKNSLLLKRNKELRDIL